MRSTLEPGAVGCPVGPSGETLCYGRRSATVIRGLGRVEEIYLYPVEQRPPGCAADEFRVLGFTARFVVAKKGELRISVPGSKQCLPRGPILAPTYPPFTIVDGAGTYAAASGTGTLTHDYNYTSSGAAGTDRWSGSLVVPGLEFDLVPPTISGGGNRSVRVATGASRVRVVYTVLARDAVDGAVPVSCLPRSRSFFPIGRSVVRCSTTDTSGNPQATRFTVTVRR